MKYADLKMDELYAWQRSPQSFELHKSDTRKIRLISLDRYKLNKSYGFGASNYSPDKAGRYVKVMYVGDPESGYVSQRADREGFITLTQIRGLWADVVKEIETHNAAKSTARDAESARRTAQSKHLDALRERIREAGMNGAVWWKGDEQGTEGIFHIRSTDLAAFLDRLDDNAPKDL